MSIEVMRYVWTKSKAKGNARLMLLAIADMTNDHGDTFPGVDRLAKKCALSKRRAQQIIQDLERSGELEVYENVGMKTSSGWTNLYRVKMEDVTQSTIRNKDNVIVLPRVAPAKKERSFPKTDEDMKPVAPLEDVQPSSPHDMKPVAPHGVKPVAPKSSVNPQVSNTYTPDGVTKRKTIPKSVIDPMKDAIVEQFGWSWDTMTKSSSGQVQSAARELCLVGLTPDRVASLYAYTKAKCKTFGPKALCTKYPEWIKTRLQTPNVIQFAPIDPADYPDTSDYYDYAHGETAVNS